MKQLRHARPRDKKGIISVAESTKIFTPEEIKCLAADLDEYFETENQDHFFVYEENKIAIGFMQFGPLPITDKSWCLYWIAVNKEVQGKGIGKKLIERLEKEVRKNLGRQLFIETSSRDVYEDTRSFYMKCKYFPVCTVPDYYGYADSKVIFGKRML